MPIHQTSSAALHGDEAALYDRHHEVLWRRVRRHIHGPDAMIDDACQQAWLILLRRQPDRETVLAWLTTVAIREAYRLSGCERRELSLDQLHPAAAEAAIDPEQGREARTALRALAVLPERQRCYLTLLVAGHSYQEIQEHCGTTRTNVNKHLYRARRSLKETRASG